ncbi:hypothetical protein PanWU01x14_326750 [Parasponia andersonii]|uniref:Uncharacterized protein n=1 Tax=Parasponia andersonii TaxID=3476 RepID=A0A2P5AJ81_PARAD|nr:hypothetical protein PanWU01x14_326750 [Parasponia andersonii]
MVVTSLVSCGRSISMVSIEIFHAPHSPKPTLSYDNVTISYTYKIQVFDRPKASQTSFIWGNFVK